MRKIYLLLAMLFIVTLTFGALIVSAALPTSLGNFTFDYSANLGYNTGTGFSNMTTVNMTQVAGLVGYGMQGERSSSASFLNNSEISTGGFCFWFNPLIDTSDTSSNASSIFYVRDPGFDKGDFFMSMGDFESEGNVDGDILWLMETASGSVGLHTTETNFVSGRWYQTCGILNNTGCYLYVDGVLDASTTACGGGVVSFFGSAIGAGSFFWGADFGGGNNLYNPFMIVDELKWFNTDVTPTQILEDYNSNKPDPLFPCSSSSAYLNYTFKDETTLTPINATMISGTFDYWNDALTVNSTLSFSNTTANYEYDFCYSDTGNVYVAPSFRFYSDGYPQRSYAKSILNLTSTQTAETLYLLSSSDGIYVTFAVINSAEESLQGVVANVTRNIEGTDYVVGSAISDAAGSITYWLNPDYAHTFTFVGEGYPTYTTVLTPTQSSYTVTLGSTSTGEIANYYKGVNSTINPTNATLLNGTTYDFDFILGSSYWEVTEFGFVLTNSSGDYIGGANDTTNGGTVTASVSTGSINNSLVSMNYYWIINSTYTNGTRYWAVLSSSGDSWSLKVFFTDLKTFLTAGVFGLDNFGMAIILFLLIFVSTGVMSYKFGITSPAAISTFIFFMVLFLDVGLGMMETLNPFGAISHFPTIFVGIIMVSLLFREVYR